MFVKMAAVAPLARATNIDFINAISYINEVIINVFFITFSNFVMDIKWPAKIG